MYRKHLEKPALIAMLLAPVLVKTWKQPGKKPLVCASVQAICDGALELLAPNGFIALEVGDL
jgi:hypothetical protein